MSYLGIIRALLPEIVLVLAALGVLSIDLAICRRRELGARWRIAMAGTVAGCAAAWLAIAWLGPGVEAIGGGRTLFNPANPVIVVDSLTQLVKQCLLLLAGGAALVSFREAFSRDPGEFGAVFLMTAVGMMLLISAHDLLMFFVAFELASIGLYLLTGFAPGKKESVEAALKYFLFGGVSAAFMLYGLSLVYGISGQTSFDAVAVEVGRRGLDPLLLAAVALVMVGFGFKVAAAPFHLWAPDAYQGGPWPAAALVASGSKLAGFVILARFTMLAAPEAAGGAGWKAMASGWAPVAAVLAVASMVIGNLGALAQRNLRRLFAYSAVAHTGYLLVAVAALGAGPGAGTRSALAALVYYAFTYGLTLVGLFGLLAVIERRMGAREVADLAGLGRRSRWLAGGLAVMVLSLAGIPPFAGFFGKLALFAGALRSGEGLGLIWLVVVAAGMSAVGLYYYVSVLKQIYVAPGTSEATADNDGVRDVGGMAALVLAVLVILFGCWPQLLISPIESALRSAGF